EKIPLGLILCAEKSGNHVELLQLEKSGIRVAQYLTDLPSKKLITQKLQEAVVLAKEQAHKTKN
ncbi:MAG: cytoplasmic protein, partial [Deltaproteobacteria bacterium]|nr:cytoplasmic protein [Deltaproteobacteria bacterium]